MGINTQFPVKAAEFKNSAELLKNAKLVKDRLYNRKAVVSESDVRILNARIDDLLKQVDKLTDEKEVLGARLAEAGMSISDIQSVALWQARRICELEGDQDAEDGKQVKETVESIIVSVLSRHPTISYRDVIGCRRAQELVAVRHECMYAVYTKRPDLSMPAIGRIFKRDHTTILSALRKFGVKPKK